MRGRAAGAALALLGAVLLTACTAGTQGAARHTAVAGGLTDAQASVLATMRLRNALAGVVGLRATLLGERSGDMALRGWLDPGHGRGYVVVEHTSGPATLVAWDPASVAFLDLPGPAPGLPPLPPVSGGWRTVDLDPGASELTRMLAALSQLGSDRPDNALLVRQNGARHLGTEQGEGGPLEHFSGVVPDGQEDAGTEYWVDEEGRTARFAIRLVPQAWSTVELLHEGERPAALPAPEELGGADG